MRVSFGQLRRAAVETVSGAKIGRVYDCELETDGQLVVQYLVRAGRWVGKTYRISRDQVVRFEQSKIIVDDAVVKDEQTKKISTQSLADPEPVAMREEI